MRRTLRPLGLAALLLTTLPAFAADSDATDKGKLDKILEEVKGVRRDMETLDGRMAQMGKDIAKDVGELRRRVEALEQAADRQSSSARSRTSTYFAPSDGPPATATLRLQNRSASAANVFINGQSFPVAPNSSRTLPAFPVGPFTYEVHADGYVIQPLVNRAVGANETFSIFINPPAAPVLLAP
jgi:hypothetical protein